MTTRASLGRVVPVPPPTIGVLGMLVGGFYFGDIVAGIDAVATRAGARLLALQTGRAWSFGSFGRRDAASAPVARSQCDGFIIIADALHETDRQALLATGKPLVTISAANPCRAHPAIFPDNRGGAQAAVNHLLDHGHRRIGFAGWLEQDDMCQRLEGYRAALLQRGIAPDPTLMFPAVDAIDSGGRAAARLVLAAGVPCTALFAATDQNALGLIAALQAAGRRVPEDVAIIGFDDIDAAQQSVPPLSSVRQDFRGLGTMAARQLLDLLAGTAVPQGTLSMPTALICRASCGCTGNPASLHQGEPAIVAPDWQPQLARQLALRLAWPLIDAGSDISWHGAPVIVAALAAALEEAPRPSLDTIEQAWREVGGRSTSAESLDAMLTLLEQAGAARLRLMFTGRRAAARRLRAFLAEAHLAILRCAGSQGVRARLQQSTTIERSHDLSYAMFGAAGSTVTNLAWVRHTGVRHACLALWEEHAGTTGPRLLLQGLYAEGSVTAASGTPIAAEDFPPQAFLAAAVRDGGLPLSVLILPLSTPERDWGYIAAVGPEDGQFHQAHDFMRHWTALLTAALEREALSRSDARHQRLLREREERYRALAEHATDLVLVTDANGTIRYASPSHMSLLGIPVTDLEQMAIDTWIHAADAQRLHRGLAAAGKGRVVLIDEIRFRHANGEWRILEMHANGRLGDPAINGIILNSHDITARKHAESELQYQALHDELTGLPNRALFNDRLAHSLLSAKRAGVSLAVCLLDLDRFKEVNYTLGHRCGDLLLKEVAERVQAKARAADTVARLGGDEFAILLPSANEGAATAIIARLTRALEAPFYLEGHQPEVAASIGIALYPLHGEDEITLLAHADIAMYAAKQAGGNGYAVYDAAFDDHSLDHLSLPQEFRQALASNGLLLYYQPLIDLATGRIAGVEALLRWPHPRHGLIPPARFLPIAERIGALTPLTQWVLDTAVQQCGVWRRAGRMLHVAVNVAPRTLQEGDLFGIVTRVLRAHDVPASCLTLEITENAIVTDPDRALSVLNQLADSGVSIAVDDFGSGYSSLAYLKRLPIHEIKIDRSFVTDMLPSARDQAIVHSIIDLSHSLGLSVVAEGIEDGATFARLAELGCDVGQGFHMSQPIPVAQLEAWLQTSGWGTPRG